MSFYLIKFNLINQQLLIKLFYLIMDVDIILPIYNAFDYVKKCIETVIEHTDLTKHTLLLVNDKSTDEQILPLISSFKNDYQSLNIKLINNEENQGFVKTVNIGMSFSHNDVILLNSDTEVTKNWLTKIQACAYSKPAIATVTPLSNNATLASVPVFMSENDLPSDINVDEYANIVEKCSMNLFPEIPTANGFCMYIKREALDNIGLFDEESFGKGYGEENDFSYRCLQAGYRHLLCDNTFIYHKGTQSFSKEKTELINSHLKILKERFPVCVENTESFTIQNPISDIQLNINYAVNSGSRKNILIVIHDFKEAEEKNIGGTTLHVHDLIKNMREKFNFHVLYYSDNDYSYHVTSFFPFDKITTSLGEYPHFTTLNLYNDDFKKDFEVLLSSLNIDLIHIHHLKHMFLDIFNVADENKIPIIYTLHDFYSICPTTILFDKKSFLCNYNDPVNCQSCTTLISNQNTNCINLWRKEFHKSLKIAKKIIVPSSSTKNILLNVYNDIAIDVIEHGYDKIHKDSHIDNTIKKDSEKFNVAFIGNITEEKGLLYLENLISKVYKTDITIHLFGRSDNKLYNKNKPNYIYHGKYLQKDLPHLLLENDINLICLLSICHETYSYTLSESLISEIPVISFNLGAIAERIKAINAGWILPVNSTTDDIYRLILDIKSDSTGEYSQKKESIRLFLKRMKSLKEMGDEYAELYNQTINRFTISNSNKNNSHLKLEFYKKSKDLTFGGTRQMEDQKEYKRVKRLIKNSKTFKQAFEEVKIYRNTYTNSKYRNKILFKLIWYKILR